MARVVDANKPIHWASLHALPLGWASCFFVVPIASVLSDQKAPCRAAALQTLTAMVDACEGFEPIAANIGTAVRSTNPLQHVLLLVWLVDWFKAHELTPGLDPTS